MKIPEEAQATRMSGFRARPGGDFHLVMEMGESTCGEEIIEGTMFPNIWPEPRCEACAAALELTEYNQNMKG